MKVGDSVITTASALGGWDHQACTGRPSERAVLRDAVGVVVQEATWMSDGSQRLDEPGVWWVARFVVDEEVLFVPCVEPDHVTVIERSEP